MYELYQSSILQTLYFILQTMIFSEIQLKKYSILHNTKIFVDEKDGEVNKKLKEILERVVYGKQCYKRVEYKNFKLFWMLF